MIGQAIDLNLLVSVCALVVSIIALVISWRSARIQNKVALLEQQNLEIDLAEKINAAEEGLLSRVEARHIKVGPKARKIRISNTGKTRVFEVRYEEAEGSDGVVMFHDKEPFEFLDPGDSYDENIVIAWGAPQKFMVTTHWKDVEGNDCSRENVINY